MISIVSYEGEDFKAVVESGEWKIGILRYSERFSNFKVLERHHLTEEAFVLLKGRAVLYVRDEENQIYTYEMEECKVYNVHKDIWHHIVVDKDTTVLVIENRNTNKENTEKVVCNEK